MQDSEAIFIDSGLQVTTRRTQGAEKALVPRWDDSVNKLPGVGKETFSKLKDLKIAGLSTPLENYRITTGKHPASGPAPGEHGLVP